MRLSPLLMAFAITASAPACASRAAPVGEERVGRVITAEQITRLNLIDALDVIERVGGYTTAESSRGAIVRQRRGRSSITNSAGDRPLLLLDNTMLLDASILRQLPADQIDRVEILSPGDATARYGTGASAGAIRIYTRGG